MFQLPPGWRPDGILNLPAVASDQFGSVRIDENGNVTPQVGSTQVFSLDGITFRCGPSGSDGCP